MSEQVEYVVVGLGALGSATAYELAHRGEAVVGLERFDLGHHRGASHDSSRILRHSYHTPDYVALTIDAYDDWNRLERASGQPLVTTVGGLDLFPPGGAIPAEDYVSSMTEVGVDFEVLGAGGNQGTLAAVHDPGGDPCPAPAPSRHRAGRAGNGHPAAPGRTTRRLPARQLPGRRRDRPRQPGRRGRHRRHHLPVPTTGRVRRRMDQPGSRGSGLAVAADCAAPAGDVLPACGARPVRPRTDATVDLDGRPVVLRPPLFREASVKMAEDCGGPVVDPDHRSFEADPARSSLLQAFAARTLPDSGPPARSVTCLYTLTPDRDFVLGPVPGHDSVLVGLGAAHGFKFAPTFGHLLADLATVGTTTRDIGIFQPDRPALTDAEHRVTWLV